ncbi:MAG: damage-inducible protein [Candidatus Nomurabacteria bacterium]|nr:damage-inducible protein [Candidatus Nomurabacteria bacterium]
MSEGDNSVFESLMHVSKKGTQYWEARELMPYLGYKTWESFNRVIERAKKACANSGNAVSDHFRDITKVIKAGKGANHEIDDVALNRYAAYLVAQNGSSTKKEIASAQTHFAQQTRRQEVFQQRINEDKRLEERNRLTGVESNIRSTVYQRGIKEPIEFASFKDAHIRALYNGKNTKQLKEERSIPSKRPLADFDSTVELAAKSLSLAMTDRNINEKDLKGADKLHREVIDNSIATREALLQRGIIPEKLKPEEDIKNIEKRRKKEAKRIGSLSKLKEIE